MSIDSVIQVASICVVLAGCAFALYRKVGINNVLITNHLKHHEKRLEPKIDDILSDVTDVKADVSYIRGKMDA